MGGAAGPDIVTKGLVLSLDAADPRSFPDKSADGTTWFNLANSFNGTLTNGPTFNSGNEGSISFDGTDDFIALGTPTALAFIYTDPFSLEVLCKPAATSGFKHLIGKSFTDYRLAQNGTGISLRLDSNNLTTQVGTLVTGEWTHIIATWEPSTSKARVYQDGILKGTSTDATVDWSSSPNNFQLANSPGENYYFNGDIAIGRAYSKTLSLDEVKQNYNATKNRFGL